MALPCNNLNLNLYRVFYTVAKTKSFSESSRTLHISQPAISKHIQNLEYELNTLLFYRTNRGIELTPEAKILFGYVEKAYNFLMLGERELMSGKDLTKGKISLGIPSYIEINYLNSYIKNYMKKHPGIFIKIINKDIEELFELFYQHTIDLLIIPSYKLNKLSKDLKMISFIKDKYCFAYSKNKNYNSNISSLEELCTKPLILPDKNNEQRQKLDELFEMKALNLDPIMEIESNEVMLSCIKNGLGIGYILEKIAKKEDDLEIVELDEELPNEEIVILYNETTLTNSTKEFINMITNQ